MCVCVCVCVCDSKRRYYKLTGVSYSIQYFKYFFIENYVKPDKVTAIGISVVKRFNVCVCVCVCVRGVASGWTRWTVPRGFPTKMNKTNIGLGTPQCSLSMGPLGFATTKMCVCICVCVYMCVCVYIYTPLRGTISERLYIEQALYH